MYSEKIFGKKTFTTPKHSKTEDSFHKVLARKQSIPFVLQICHFYIILWVYE